MAANIKVIDASFVLAFLLPDERLDQVEAVFIQLKKHQIELFSTPLLPFEVLNGIKSALFSKRIDKSQALKLADNFLKLGIELKEVGFKEVFDLAVTKKLTVYDAAYLQLSLSNNISLLTFDDQLIRLAR